MDVQLLVSIALIVGLTLAGSACGRTGLTVPPTPPAPPDLSTWKAIGPAPAMGPFGGRIDVAAPDPSNSDVMYLGANNGGIWKTTNWSAPSPNWIPLTDQQESLAIHEHDLVVVPGNNNNIIVLAAASGPGGGILRYDSAGNTWSFLAKSYFDLAEFGALVVDPNVANAKTLYVAVSAGVVKIPSSTSGVYKSIDGGATWTDAGVGVFSGFVSDLLEIQENGKTVLYAADAGNGQTGSGGIYRNDGSGWKPTNLPPIPNGIHFMRLAGSTAPTEQIYASIIDNSTPTLTSGVVSRFVTSNQGGNWQPLTRPEAPSVSIRYRHNLLAVDPANSSHVYVNTDTEPNLVNQECIYMSSDSGQTMWKAALDCGGDPASGGFDGKGVFIATGDAGIRRDPVNLTPDKANRSGNLNNIEFYSFSLDPNNAQTGYGLFQDGPGVLKYVGAPDWVYKQPPAEGESGKVRVDPTNPMRVYWLDPNCDPISCPGSLGRLLLSNDGGLTWAAAGVSGLATNQKNGVTFTDYASYPGKRSIIIDPKNSKRLLLALRSVFETTTGGDPNLVDPNFNPNGWRDIGTQMGNNGATISAIAMAPSAPNTVYAGTEDGHVFRTTDAQDKTPMWKPVDNGLPFQNQRIMDLNIDPLNPDHLFAVTSPFMGRDGNAPDFSGFPHVWVYNGADAGWSPINGTLPPELGGETLAVNWQPLSAVTMPLLYLGTLRGAFQSTDLGTTWNPITSIPRTRVTDLDFMPNLIGAGTIGRGAWETIPMFPTSSSAKAPAARKNSHTRP